MKVLCYALDITLKFFKIRAQDLSKDSGVAAASISNFRNDTHGITTDSLEKLLENLSEEAFVYWLSQVAHARGIEEFIKNPIALAGFVSRLDDDLAAELLMALAKKIREEHRKEASV